MKTVIKNHLIDIQLSTAKMLLLHSDNRVLITYFKDMAEKLVYLEELTEQDSKYDWMQIESFMEGLIKQDSELTNININFQIQEIASEKKEARLTVKSF
jgi:molybdopterin/thiamine biosynthesis adenylyltransferase